MFDRSSLSARSGQLVLSGLLAIAAATPNVAEAAWPKVFEADVCWSYTCNGTPGSFTSVTWVMAQDGTFADQYGSTGQYFIDIQFSAWPYFDDFLLFYDNGQTSYVGSSPEPVSINEFINEPNGQEWIELYNYSKKPVSLRDWTLNVGTGSIVLGNIVLPGQTQLVLTSSAPNFIAQWGVGTQGLNVIQVPLPALPNGAGTISLVDELGKVAWQVSYVNDGLPGFSTVLTELDMHHFEHPSVTRDGFDDLLDGYVGYESYATHNDRYDFLSTLGDRGSPLDGPRGTARPLYQGTMVTYVFYPPYIIEGFWCEDGC